MRHRGADHAAQHDGRQGATCRGNSPHVPRHAIEPLGQQPKGARALFKAADGVGERGLHVLQGAADGERQLDELAADLAGLAFQRFDHLFRGDLALFGQGTQLPDRHAQTIGQCFGEARRLFEDGVELFAAQRARGEGLPELR